MKDYERMTDKRELQKPSCYNCRYNFAYSMTCERYCANGDYFELRPEIEKLIEIEDKLENGTMIELPCKIGDIVYHIDLEIPESQEQCYECKYNCSGFGEFYCDKGYVGHPRAEDKLGNKNVCPKYQPYIWEEKFSLDFYAKYQKYFGITWFLTKAEAEAKLRELQGDRE